MWGCVTAPTKWHGVTCDKLSFKLSVITIQFTDTPTPNNSPHHDNPLYDTAISQVQYIQNEDYKNIYNIISHNFKHENLN